MAQIRGKVLESLGQDTRKRDKKERKNGSGQKAKPSTPTQATDACMGEEEKNRKQKEEKKQGTDPPPSYLDGTVQCSKTIIFK